MLEWLDSATLLAACAVCREWRDVARGPALWTEARRPCASAWFSRTPREAFLRARAAAAVRASGQRAPVKIGPHCPRLTAGWLTVHDERIAVFGTASQHTVYTYAPPSPWSPGHLPAEHRHSTGTLRPSTLCLHGSRLAVITTAHGRPLLIDADRPDAPCALFDAPPSPSTDGPFYGCWHEAGAALTVVSRAGWDDDPVELCGWDTTTGMRTVTTKLAVGGGVRHLCAAYGALLVTVCDTGVLLLDPRAAYAPVVRHDPLPLRSIWHVVASPCAPLVAVEYLVDRIEVLDVRAFAAPLLVTNGGVSGFAGAHLCTTRESVTDDGVQRHGVWTPLDGAAPPTTVDLGPYSYERYPSQADARRLVYGLCDGLYQLDYDPAPR